jgi:AcrR family transcriptional regulator
LSLSASKARCDTNGYYAVRVRRTGRPPLTERRRAATRLEIAQAAVGLFTSKGVSATSAEEIAEAVGISTRTLWRYFPSKESCVRPLLAAGIQAVGRRLRAWAPGTPLVDALRDMDAWAAPETGQRDLVEAGSVLALIRLTRTEPGLRAVWLQAHHDAEPVFAQVLAERTGRGAEDLAVKVQAAMINTALRVAVEDHAWRTAGAGDGGGLQDALRRALLAVSEGLPD